MKKEIYVIENEGKQLFCIYEETARKEAEEIQKNYLTTKVNEKAFENMLNKGIFLDAEVYLKSITSHVQIEENKLPESPDIQTLVDKVNEMQLLLKSLQSENQALKNRPRLTIEQAKELHDKKQLLLSNKLKFDTTKESINKALSEIDNILELDENKSFRLVMFELDHENNKGSKIFSITTNIVIHNTMKYVKNEVLNKIADLDFQIGEIENIFI